MNDDYRLIDSGQGRKLEEFGSLTISRPSLQALWSCSKSELWHDPDAVFTREPDGVWKKKRNFPEHWEIQTAGIRFKLSATDFGHLGIFPEQRAMWQWLQKKVDPSMEVLNLFAYSGGSTLACAKAGGKVCHLDASKKMVSWAKENAALNNLQNAPIRWIVDDVKKFLKREVKRGRFYDGIILDPPSFGRGAQGEVFKIEKDLPEVLALCKELLTKQPRFIVLSCHSAGFTPTTLTHLLDQMMGSFKGEIEAGEMFLEGEGTLIHPSGCFARWCAC